MPDSSNALLDAIANPRQVDVLGAYRGANNILQGQWAVREMQARQAAGEAYQQATNPLTGEVDPAKAQAIIAGNPAAALHAQPSATTGQALQQAQQNRSIQGQAHVNQTLTSLLTLGDDQMTPQTIKAGLDQLVAARSITPQDEQAAIAGLPPNATAQQIRQYLVQHTVANLAGPEAAAKILPTQGPDITTPSNGLQGTLRAPLLSPTTPGAIGPSGGEVPQGAGPGSDNEVMTITNPDGSLTTDTKAGLKASGKISPTTGQPMPGYMVPPPKASGGSYVGKPNPLLGGLPNPAEIDTPAPAAGKTSGGTTVNSGTLDRQAADRKQFSEAQANVGPANTAVHNLQNAYQALILTNSGSGTEATHKLYAFIQNQAPAWLQSQHLTDDVKNYDLFRKYTEKYALDQGAQSNTDAGRAMSAASNAGTAISTPANLDVMRYEIGRQRQSIASVMLHKDPTGNGFGKANADHMTGTDPHGFAWDTYSPKERQTFIERAKKDGTYDKLVRSVQAAIDSHQIADPRGQ